MLILREPADASQVEDVSIRALITQRFEELRSDNYDWSELGYFIMVQPHDNIDDLESGHRICINTSPVSFELLEEHTSCFELVFVLDDSGFGVTVIVPKHTAMNDTLMQFCHEYAHEHTR
jgi:hypothetical protein